MSFLKGYFKPYWCVKHQMKKIHYNSYEGKARDAVIYDLSGLHFCPQCVYEYLEGPEHKNTQAALERVNKI